MIRDFPILVLFVKEETFRITSPKTTEVIVTTTYGRSRGDLLTNVSLHFCSPSLIDIPPFKVSLSDSDSPYHLSLIDDNDCATYTRIVKSSSDQEVFYFIERAIHFILARIAEGHFDQEEDTEVFPSTFEAFQQSKIEIYSQEDFDNLSPSLQEMYEDYWKEDFRFRDGYYAGKHGWNLQGFAIYGQGAGFIELLDHGEAVVEMDSIATHKGPIAAVERKLYDYLKNEL